MEEGETTYDTIGETLEKLTANPEMCATYTFPMTGITVTLASAGDGQWHMLTNSETRGIIDVAKVDEESLLFRLSATDVVEKIAAQITAERAAPQFMADLEAHLASEGQK